MISKIVVAKHSFLKEHWRWMLLRYHVIKFPNMLPSRTLSLCQACRLCACCSVRPRSLSQSRLFSTRISWSSRRLGHLERRTKCASLPQNDIAQGVTSMTDSDRLPVNKPNWPKFLHGARPKIRHARYKRLLCITLALSRRSRSRNEIQFITVLCTLDFVKSYHSQCSLSVYF